tara:strand:+ start:1062 stop:1634 length:573 start_codon:yes stop_codon:yes gene_type:complete
MFQDEVIDVSSIDNITNNFSRGMLKIYFKKDSRIRSQRSQYIKILSSKIKIIDKDFKNNTILISDCYEKLFLDYIDNKRDKFNFSKIKKILKQVMSDDQIQDAYYNGLSRCEYNLIQGHTLGELKELSFQNYITKNIIKKEIQENMSFLRTWAIAITYSKRWSFNTFVIGIRKKKINLCDDVLFIIKKFL